mmetsp:Transcript_2732/g.9143  ORF Transcript_2732/g.9143 Transcript_2732/m.9143 type:complete len:302 (-) Transcript_2732:937-1842(-)
MRVCHPLCRCHVSSNALQASARTRCSAPPHQHKQILAAPLPPRACHFRQAGRRHRPVARLPRHAAKARPPPAVWHADGLAPLRPHHRHRRRAEAVEPPQQPRHVGRPFRREVVVLAGVRSDVEEAVLLRALPRLRGADTEGAVAPLSDGVARGGAVLARRRVPPVLLRGVDLPRPDELEVAKHECVPVGVRRPAVARVHLVQQPVARRRAGRAARPQHRPVVDAVALEVRRLAGRDGGGPRPAGRHRHEGRQPIRRVELLVGDREGCRGRAQRQPRACLPPRACSCRRAEGSSSSTSPRCR